MMQSLQQTELDLFEEHVLSCLFGDAHNPKVSSFIGTFLAFQGKSLEEVLNNTITSFERFAAPLLADNGFVDGEKAANIIHQIFGQTVALPNFRLIDISKAIEPFLRKVGSMIQ